MKQRIYLILGLLVFGFLGCQKDSLTKKELIQDTEIQAQISDVEIQKYIHSDESRIRYFLGETQTKGAVELESRTYDEILEKIKLEIAREDMKWGFVKEHEKNYGYPDWEKCNKYLAGSANDYLYFIPLVKNKKVEAIIASKILNNGYHFDIIDRKNMESLIKKENASSLRINLLPFVGEILSLGYKLHGEKNWDFYKWYESEIKRVNGLNSLELRCGVVTVCQNVPSQCDPIYNGNCPVFLIELESRGSDCTSYNVGCGIENANTTCTLCGSVTSSAGSGGGTNTGGVPGDPTQTITCYDATGDPITCAAIGTLYNISKLSSNYPKAEIINQLDIMRKWYSYRLTDFGAQHSFLNSILNDGILEWDGLELFDFYSVMYDNFVKDKGRNLLAITQALTPLLDYAVFGLPSTGAKFSRAANSILRNLPGSVANSRSSIWNRISNSYSKWTNTEIPLTFRYNSNGKNYYVNSNATEHMAEWAGKSAGSISGMQIRAQSILTEFGAAVDDIISKNPNLLMADINGNGGIIYTSGRWGIKFGVPANNSGGLPSIIHALRK